MRTASGGVERAELLDTLPQRSCSERPRPHCRLENVHQFALKGSVIAARAFAKGVGEVVANILGRSSTLTGMVPL